MCALRRRDRQLSENKTLRRLYIKDKRRILKSRRTRIDLVRLFFIGEVCGTSEVAYAVKLLRSEVCLKGQVKFTE